jgi:hypothetical protein
MIVLIKIKRQVLRVFCFLQFYVDRAPYIVDRMLAWIEHHNLGIERQLGSIAILNRLFLFRLYYIYIYIYIYIYRERERERESCNIILKDYFLWHYNGVLHYLHKY